jgi:hypothetical protein
VTMPFDPDDASLASAMSAVVAASLACLKGGEVKHPFALPAGCTAIRGHHNPINPRGRALGLLPAPRPRLAGRSRRPSEESGLMRCERPTITIYGKQSPSERWCGQFSASKLSFDSRLIDH